MEFSKAKNLAHHILETMQPYCQRAAIAGSIRRQKDQVKDIEIVAIPAFGSQVDLFGDVKRNLLFDWASLMDREDRIHWIKPGTNDVIRWTIKEDGKYWRGWLVKAKIKLDLFLTTPDTWGITYLIRTGPADFSARVVSQEARRFGHSFRDGKLYDNFNRELRCPEEIDVFNHLGILWKEPEARI